MALKPKTGGRKAGTPNKKIILRVEEVLLRDGVNPTEEIMRIIPTLEAKDQVKAYQFLLTYLQAPLKASEAPPPQEVTIPVTMTKENLISLAKKPN